MARPELRGLFANTPIGQRLEAFMSQIHQVLVGTLPFAQHLRDGGEHFHGVDLGAVTRGAF
jgi:hypothetical protein